MAKRKMRDCLGRILKIGDVVACAFWEEGADDAEQWFGVVSEVAGWDDMVVMDPVYDEDYPKIFSRKRIVWVAKSVDDMPDELSNG